MVICLERGADLHMAQLMPLAVSCFSKILIGFTFLVPANPGVCVCLWCVVSCIVGLTAVWQTAVREHRNTCVLLLQYVLVTGVWQ